jgi:hypothetical protein
VPGFAGETLTLKQTSPTADGTVSLQNINGAEEVIYSAPSSIPASTNEAASYTVTGQYGATVSGSATVTLLSNPVTLGFTGHTVTWTVPTTGTYDIVAAGAQAQACSISANARSCVHVSTPIRALVRSHAQHSTSTVSRPIRRRAAIRR